MVEACHITVEAFKISQQSDKKLLKKSINLLAAEISP